MVCNHSDKGAMPLLSLALMGGECHLWRPLLIGEEGALEAIRPTSPSGHNLLANTILMVKKLITLVRLTSG